MIKPEVTNILNNEENEENKETCPICLEYILFPKNNICITICNHKFHTSCILQISNTKICPYCRQELFNNSNSNIKILSSNINANRNLQNYQLQNELNFSIIDIVARIPRFTCNFITFIILMYCINIICSIILIFFETNLQKIINNL